jgi:hypothetical protein
VPALRLTGDMAKMAGFPAGLAWAVGLDEDENIPARDDVNGAATE